MTNDLPSKILYKKNYLNLQEAHIYFIHKSAMIIKKCSLNSIFVYPFLQLFFLFHKVFDFLWIVNDVAAKSYLNKICSVGRKKIWLTGSLIVRNHVFQSRK